MNTDTIFSDDQRYRYTLWRIFDSDLFNDRSQLKFSMVVGLNPSTADAVKNDATIRRCISFSQRLGFDALCMTNLFAIRSVNRHVIKITKDPVGPDNLKHLERIAPQAGIIIAAWGNDGHFKDQDLKVCELMARLGVKLKAFRLTDTGAPEHPLYIPYGLPLLDFIPNRTPDQIASAPSTVADSAP